MYSDKILSVINQVQIACSKAGQPVIRCDFTNHLPNEILLILFLFIIALTFFIEKLYMDGRRDGQIDGRMGMKTNKDGQTGPSIAMG